MGAKLSSNLPILPDNFEHFAVTFRLGDNLKVLHADQQTLNRIRMTILDNYAPGIMNEKPTKKGESFTFVLKGNPFQYEKHEPPTSNTDRQMADIFCRRLFCELLKDLQKIGWYLVLSSDLSRAVDLATWFFRRKTYQELPAIIENSAHTRLLSVSLISHDRLMFVNAPRDIFPIFRSIVQMGRVCGLRSSNKDNGGDKILFGGLAYEVVLDGRPWRAANFEESLFARRTILEIFRNLRNKGYRFCGIASADCLFFEQTLEMPPPNQDYTLMTLTAPDIIRLTDAPLEIIDVVRETIFEILGSKKIQKETNYTSRYKYFEFQLYGNPWNSSGTESISVRHMISRIFQKFRTMGLRILASLELSRRNSDKTFFVFKSAQPKEDVRHMCFSPADNDKLRLINPCKGAGQLIRNVIKDHWPPGINKESIKYRRFCVEKLMKTALVSDTIPSNKLRYIEWKLNGEPWEYKSGFDYSLVRHLMCAFLDEFTRQNWEVLCSADVTAKYHHQRNGKEYPMDVQSWYLAYSVPLGVEQKVRRNGRLSLHSITSADFEPTEEISQEILSAVL